MGFFTIGNIITLGIVLIILVLYRQLDKNNRTLKLLREHSEKLKKELGDFVKDQEKAVKDYSISLNVEKDSAKELMKRLQQLNEQELNEKAKAVARIDNQIKAYESSLAELDQMTGRVQENMNRIRDESAFVESIGKRLGEAKNSLSGLEKDLTDLENRFERENTESLEKAIEEVTAFAKSTVSDFAASAEVIERQVEDHRREIKKIEEARAANMARDTEIINKYLARAVEQAGKRADKMEEAALANLREQAEDRIRKIKAAEEERLRNYHESAKARVAEVQNLVKAIREEWRAERSDWESKDKAFKDERKREMQELNVYISASEKQFAEISAVLEKNIESHSARTNELISAQENKLRAVFTDSEKRFGAELTNLEKLVEEFSAKTKANVSAQEALLQKTSEEMKQKALEITGARLEEYRQAQDAEFRRLEALADDSKNLDVELRRYMQEITTRIKGEFSQYEQESAGLRKIETDKFVETTAALKDELEKMGKDLAILRATSQDNVSEKLSLFEDSFITDLSNRKSEIDKRLIKWHENLDEQLDKIASESENGRLELERSLTDELKNKFSILDNRLVSELEHLKTKVEAFEEGIRGQMSTADESVYSFKEQLEQSLVEARKEAEISIRAEVGKHSLTTAETVKQYQRELEGKFREISEYVQARNGEISSAVELTRTELDEAQKGLESKIRELDGTVEDARRRVRDLAAETDNRISAVRSSVEDAERHIREAVDQTKLIDKAEALRLDVVRRIEDLKADMERLEQHRAEAAQLENDFVKIKRLEDDVNAKMTRFLSEKRRIETMENDFNRLLQISRAVEEKLSHVTASDDILQGIQLQIRKMEEALGKTEEKFQRIERKNQILDNTNDGIDRNFKALQETEKLSVKIRDDLDQYGDELDMIKTSIEKLSVESEKAKDAVDRIDVLNNALEEIEDQIKAVQDAKKWIAAAETRLEELNKQAQNQARFIDAMVKGKKSKTAVNLGQGAPSIQKQETIIQLILQGWTDEEIAMNMKVSIGEVQLIRELVPRDRS